MRWAWLSSIVLHALLFASIALRFFPDDSNTLQKMESLEVRTLTEKDLQKELAKALDKDHFQIVATDAPKNDQKSLDKKEYFLSKNNQDVDYQTRAAKVGKFKNVPIENLLDTGVKSKEETLKNEVKDIKPTESASGIVIKKSSPHRKIASISESGIQNGESSANEDFLPDIAIGVQTLLNTKEYKFYGFYERIRERIAYEWRNQVEYEVPKLMGQGANPLAADRVTQLKVFIDPQGNLKNTQVVGSSGYDELDRAALEAFQKAAPFPNPPTQMVDASGTVSIRWDFVVLASQGYSPQVQVRRVQ